MSSIQLFRQTLSNEYVIYSNYLKLIEQFDPLIYNFCMKIGG